MAEAGKKKRAVPKGRHKSQMKRERQDIKRRARNLQIKSLLKTAIKKVRQAVSEKNREKAGDLLRNASRTIQKAASKGAIHKRNASRKIARLATMVRSIAS